MLSMPPATITSAEPAASMSCAKIAACMPEPQTLLTVTASAELGRPAPIAAWRAGAWPRPADSTLPMNTLSTCSPVMPARSTAALTAVAPSSVARDARQRALEAAHRRAGVGEDDDRVGGGSGHVCAPELNCCTAHKTGRPVVQTLAALLAAAEQEIRHVRRRHSISTSAKWRTRSARRPSGSPATRSRRSRPRSTRRTSFRAQLWPQMGELGLHGITVEEEWGGLGLGYLEHVVAQEEVARASASVGLSYGAHSNLCVNQIRRWANPEQKKQISPQADQRRACRRAGDERSRRGQRRRRDEAQGRKERQRLPPQRHQILDHQRRLCRHARRLCQDRRGQPRASPPS